MERICCEGISICAGASVDSILLRREADDGGSGNGSGYVKCKRDYGK